MHQFHSLHQDQSTVAPRTEMTVTVDEYSLRVVYELVSLISSRTIPTDISGTK